MNIQDVLSEWKVDCVIDQADLLREILRTSVLNAKYLDYFVLFNSKLSQAEKKHDRMIWVKRKYFRGEMQKNELDQYGWSQWNGLKPNSTELATLLEADVDMCDLREKVSMYKTAVKTVESIIKEITNRGYALKAAAEYQRFMAGV